MNQGIDNMTGYYSNTYDSQQKQMNSAMNTFLFAADLPEDTCEEDLYGFFTGYKMVTSKVVQNINNTYAFVNFETRNDAERARRELNGVTIQAKYASGINKISKPVRLCRYESRSGLSSIDPRCNLLVKNLSPQVSAHLLWNTFIKFGDVRSSKLMIDIMGESKGFGFISYYRWEDAMKAKEQLNDKDLLGKNLKINFLEKGRRHVVKKNNIYVKEIPKKNFTEKELIELFSKFGKINSAVILKDEKGESKGFGFVCFEKPEDAEKAKNEMNGKKVFDDVENKLYVSFALKKAERKEELIKMKEKLFKESQKMTIYAKIQDDEAIKTDEIFKKRIMEYLQQLMGIDYKPKFIKTRFEQKNAFITMNNKEDARNFIKKFIEIDGKKDIFFNTYKSRFDRKNAQMQFKNYNNFSETGSQAHSSTSSMAGRHFVNYNDFGNQQMAQRPQQIPNQRNQGRPAFKNYNNFDDMNNQFNQLNINNNAKKNYVNYNDFETDVFTKTYQELRRKMEPNKMITTLEQAGDFIYELAECLYNKEAGKITGMILEYSIEKLNNMIIFEPQELKKQIINGHNLLQNAPSSE
jgi:RNA recognition motif-containing protein